jgi:hypothetical protein
MANEAVVAVPGVLRQTLILTQKNLLVKARSWKTSLSELLFPVLLLLMFNAPNIFVDRPSAAPTEVVHYGPIPAVLANTTTALEAAIGEVVSVLAPPLFPPTPPYDALRPPLFWDKSSSGPHGGVPILGIAPTSSARASLQRRRVRRPSCMGTRERRGVGGRCLRLAVRCVLERPTHVFEPLDVRKHLRPLPRELGL